MKKLLLALIILAFSLSQQRISAAPTTQQLYTAYKYAYNLYSAHRYKDALEIFKKVILLSRQPELNANSLFYYSQCAFRTQDYDACVKALTILVKRWPNSAAVRKGYVSRFCVFLIPQCTNLVTNWDYYRYDDGKDDKGNTVWKESVPPGFKIRKINFKLGFGLFRVLNAIQPNSPQTLAAKQKLDAMINTPIKLIWVDEKAPIDHYGHPVDFASIFSLGEKKDFSKVICDRLFYNWKSEKFYQFLDMYDDIRNLKPRYVAKTKLPEETPTPTPGQAPDPTAIFTLSRLFLVSGYNPYNDSYTNLIEASPSDLTF